jgi:hypothetical protein
MYIIKQPTIAIMLLVHSNENQVNRLIKHLASDFDIYVHIDKRSSIKIEQNKNIFVYKKYPTYWGSFNITMATLFLLKKAYNKGYARYLLISGQDLPIKTNNEIKAFFEKDSNEYINFGKIPENGWPNMERVTKYNMDDKYHGCEELVKYNLLYRFHRKIFRIINKYFFRRLDYDFYGGANWTNYTHECVRKIFEYLEKDRKYIKRYKWTSCSDEIFFQTILNKIEGITIINDSLRYVDWETGPEYPRILRTNDYEKVIESEKLFARKFDEKIDREIIELIYKGIESKENCA